MKPVARQVIEHPGNKLPAQIRIGFDLGKRNVLQLLRHKEVAMLTRQLGWRVGKLLTKLSNRGVHFRFPQGEEDHALWTLAQEFSGNLVANQAVRTEDQDSLAGNPHHFPPGGSGPDGASDVRRLIGSDSRRSRLQGAQVGFEEARTRSVFHDLA